MKFRDQIGNTLQEGDAVLVNVGTQSVPASIARINVGLGPTPETSQPSIVVTAVLIAPVAPDGTAIGVYALKTPADQPAIVT